MKLKRLAVAKYEVVAVMDGEDCPAESFLMNGEDSTAASRKGLLYMLQMVAENGLQDIPAAWFHEANKQEQIYEFVKGPLRLFFFKGKGRQITVCTTGVRKSGQKADKASVAKASTMREVYFAATDSNTLEVVNHETE